jgi:hypothetical protein
MDIGKDSVEMFFFFRSIDDLFKKNQVAPTVASVT